MRGKKKVWWFVTGRRCGEDEDGCGIYKVSTEDEAMEAFREELREVYADDSLGRDEDNEGSQIYINYVIDCGDQRPRVASGP